ncbi:MAG: Ig-like domain-containing protein, partial [Candidatus Saccharimonas sp.]
MKSKKIRPKSRVNLRLMGVWVGAFAVIGVTTLLITRAATPGIPVVVDSSLPNPTNVRTYGDDRVATVTWSAPANADSKNIVGYYITWGSQSGGTYTNAKQSTHVITQIQPLTNGVTYNVKVQSVQGNTVQVPTPDAWGGGSAPEARANGKVSSGTVATVTSSSARVDSLRAQMTGFFDDFNAPAGAMDELKWNTATTGCAGFGETGAFLNNQFHDHTQVRTPTEDRYCDRSSNVARVRPTFDISGKTESNPGVIVGDFDGAFMQSGRDTWYIDLVPLAARKNNIPLDITSHADAFDTATADPAMIRMTQNRSSVSLNYTGNDKRPHQFDTYQICPDFKQDLDFNGWCGKLPAPSSDEYPIVDQITSTSVDNFPTPNVRYHWRIEISPAKVKVFLNGYRILEGATPADFVNVTKYSVQSNLFSYNTGKDAADEKEQTSLLHWDNFGFNGPAPTTVVHNYIDGAQTGTTPIIGTGPKINNPISDTNRALKINIPDPIASPSQARLMFTETIIGNGTYVWSPGDSVSVNSHKYAIPNPNTVEQSPVILDSSAIATSYIPFAQGIVLNKADLKQGLNDIVFSSTNGFNAINVHIELEYDKGSEPSYTQPTAIFGASTLLAAIQPTMLAHDNYLFIEQDMGLPSGTIDSGTPVGPPPTTGDTTKPTVTLTAPANATALTVGDSFTASASASDNVGVTRVEFYIGNTLKATDTSSPYSANISTTGLSPGTYNITAIAYDANNNQATSNIRTIAVSAVVNAQVPMVTMAVDGLNIKPSDTSIAVRDRNAVVWRPTVSSSNGTVNVTYIVNGSNITLSNGAYTFGNKSGGNDDYQLTVIAKDSANLSTTKSLTIRLRSPDINRSGKVDISDIGILAKNWARNDAGSI